MTTEENKVPEIITHIDEYRFVCLVCDWVSHPFSQRISPTKLAIRETAFNHVLKAHPNAHPTPWMTLKIIYFSEYEYEGKRYTSNYANSIPEPLVLYALRRAIRVSRFSERVPAYAVSHHLLHYFRKVWGSPSKVNYRDAGTWQGHDQVINALNRLRRRGVIRRDVIEVSSAYSHAILKQRALGEPEGARGVGHAWKKKIAFFSLEEGPTK